MSEKLIGSACSVCGMVFSPFMQWERLRNPLAGWARLVLAVLFPFIIWSHDWLLIGLWTMAVFSHPYWFPAYVEAGEDVGLMTRLVDVLQKWMQGKSPDEKLKAFLPGIIIFFPMVGAFWSHNLFWGIYFIAAALLMKALFFIGLLQGNNGCDT